MHSTLVQYYTALCTEVTIIIEIRVQYSNALYTALYAALILPHDVRLMDFRSVWLLTGQHCTYRYMYSDCMYSCVSFAVGCVCCACLCVSLCPHSCFKPGVLGGAVRDRWTMDVCVHYS